VRRRVAATRPGVSDGDLQTAAAPIDFLGINYYETKIAAHDPGEPYHQARVLPPVGKLTAGGLDVRPAGLGRILRRVSSKAAVPLFITENGAAFNDYADPEGGVDDLERVDYLADHFGAALAAIESGVDLRGYFVWSLVHNFEWARRVRLSLRLGLRRLRHPGPHPEGQRPLVPGAHRQPGGSLSNAWLVTAARRARRPAGHRFSRTPSLVVAATGRGAASRRLWAGGRG
jgi:hypothetical protein